MRQYRGGKLRVPGEQFGIKDRAAFSDVWMATKDDLGPDMRRVNTGGTDGVVGVGVPKPGQKMSAKDRIEYARSLTGRDDINTAKEADAILASVQASGSDNDDRSRDFASDPSDDAPIEAVED